MSVGPSVHTASVEREKFLHKDWHFPAERVSYTEAVLTLQTIPFAFRLKDRCKQRWCRHRLPVTPLLKELGHVLSTYSIVPLRCTKRKGKGDFETVKWSRVGHVCGEIKRDKSSRPCRGVVACVHQWLWRVFQREYKLFKTLICNEKKAIFHCKTGGYNPNQDALHQLPRHQQTIIFRFRTGHCRLNSDLKRIGVKTSTQYPCGEADQTPEHYLQSCSLHQQARQQILLTCVPIKARLWGSAEDLFLASKYAALTGKRI